MSTIGLISDTHGYLDPRLKPAFERVDAIVHAGDVGGPHVLDFLRDLAPLHAVYGNNDEKLGGLGLHLIRKAFDQVDYNLKKEGTELVLSKGYPPHSR